MNDQSAPTTDEMIALIMRVEATGLSEEMQDRLLRRLREMNRIKLEGMYRACRLQSKKHT